MDVLVERATALLRSGTAPPEAFVRIVGDGGDADAATRAICTALGVPLAEAQRRVRQHSPRQLLQELEPEDDALAAAGDLLAFAGCFDVPHQPDEREQAILAALDTAASTRRRWASGVWAGCRRLRCTGRYADLFTRLVRYGDRDVPDPAAYWEALAAGADLLGDLPDITYQAAVQVTRERTEATR